MSVDNSYHRQYRKPVTASTASRAIHNRKMYRHFYRAIICRDEHERELTELLSQNNTNGQ